MDVALAFQAYQSAIEEAAAAWQPLGVDAVRLQVRDDGSPELVAESRAPATSRRALPPTWDNLPVRVESSPSAPLVPPTAPARTTDPRAYRVVATASGVPMLAPASFTPVVHHSGQLSWNPADWQPAVQDVTLWLAIAAGVAVVFKVSGATALVAFTAGAGTMVVLSLAAANHWIA